MTFVLVLTCILVALVEVNPFYVYRNMTCGRDNTKTEFVYEGIADIENYPWIGTLVYPIGRRKATTSVVLVTKQIVLASANEIDKIPKIHFRARSRVVLGRKCNGPGIKVRDYVFHPDFKQYSDSALAIIQMEVGQMHQELRPICAAPTFMIKPEFYAMTTGNCNKGKVRIYKMQYVSIEQCLKFYRRFGLNINKYWPQYTTCASAVSGARLCKWASGTVLAMKQDGYWRLLGFGLNGPGCRSPARFLDYGMQQAWVRSNVARIGAPAITRLADNHIILRRSLGNLRRFGECDQEEMQYEIFTDRVIIETEKFQSSISYNLTLYAMVEYSCIIFRAKDLDKKSSEESEELETEEPTTAVDTTTESIRSSDSGRSSELGRRQGLASSGESSRSGEEEKAAESGTDGSPTTSIGSLDTTKPPKKKTRENPSIYLRRWCAGAGKLCYGFHFAEIIFYVDIKFTFATVFTIAAYGKKGEYIDPIAAMTASNKFAKPKWTGRFQYKPLLLRLKADKNADRTHRWFYKSDISRK